MNDFSPAQKRAIEILDRNMAVKAGAGAGKTRVLVERYIRMLETGAAALDGIVAITFTRKAAKEMQDRIRQRLRQLAQGCNDPEFAGHWRQVARNFAAASISTIHSLCSRILRENPAEAGIDPEFSLLDEADSQVLLAESWQAVLDRAAGQDSEWLLRLLAVYSPTQLRQDLFGLFQELEAAGIIGPDLEAELAVKRTGNAALSVDRLREAYQRVFAALPASGRLTASQQRLLAIRDDWPAIETTLTRIPAEPGLLEALEPAWKGLRGGGELGEAIKEWKSAAAQLRGALADERAGKVTPDLAELLRQASACFARTKCARRSLTYDDLEQMTEQLLRENPVVCAGYNRRIHFVMVDECQDINERQRRIIYLLAGGDAAVLRGTGLFVVGDSKQSIYRFRGADSRVFARMETDILASGGETVELLDNYRSHSGLISAFNEFFAELMPASVCEAAETLDAVEYRHLQGTKGEKGQERLEMWVLDGDALAGADARDQEAEMIAGRIREMVAEAGSAVQFGDIAILLRAFSRVEAYEAALAKAAVPYYVAGGRGLGDKQEVLDALGLLRFLGNRCNEIALFGLLRSPFFLLSDETLLKLRQSGGSEGIWGGLGRAAAMADLQPHEVEQATGARALLEQWLARRDFLMPGDLLREAFAATGFDLLQLTQFNGNRRFANLRKLLDMADAFAVNEHGGLAEFLRYAELRLHGEGEAELDSETGNAVRIMTIHKAKGLEFPVVIVPDLQRKFVAQARLAVFVKGYGLGLKVADNHGSLRESAGFRRIAGVDAAMERAELKRVLYVAMTRAERRIILSAVAKRGKTPKNMKTATGWLDWIKVMLNLPEAPDLWPDALQLGDSCVKVRRGMADNQAAAQLVAAAEFAAPTGGTLPEPIRQRIGCLCVGKTKPLVLSPSRFAAFATCQRSYYYGQIARMPELPESFAVSTEAVEPGPVPGQILGIAFHRVLELLDNRLAWREALERAVREKISPELRDEAATRLRFWLRQYLDSPTFAEIGGAVEERREWSFQYRLLPATATLPAVWLSGQVDRVLLRSDGSLGIVDYKTDWVTPGGLQQKTARYRLQLAGYALGAGAALGREVGYAGLYFARTGEHAAVDVSMEALLSAREEMQQLADFIRSHDREAEYACNTSHCDDCRWRGICPQT